MICFLRSAFRLLAAASLQLRHDTYSCDRNFDHVVHRGACVRARRSVHHHATCTGRNLGARSQCIALDRGVVRGVCGLSSRAQRCGVWSGPWRLHRDTRGVRRGARSRFGLGASRHSCGSVARCGGDGECQTSGPVDIGGAGCAHGRDLLCSLRGYAFTGLAGLAAAGADGSRGRPPICFATRSTLVAACDR